MFRGVFFSFPLSFPFFLFRGREQRNTILRAVSLQRRTYVRVFINRDDLVANHRVALNNEVARTSLSFRGTVVGIVIARPRMQIRGISFECTASRPEVPFRRLNNVSGRENFLASLASNRANDANEFLRFARARARARAIISVHLQTKRGEQRR